MERIKSKILKNSNQLREECEAVKALLNTILEKNDEITSYTANITEYDVQANKKYLSEAMLYQSTVTQKLLEMGLDLDAFSKQPFSHTAVENSMRSPDSHSELSPYSSHFGSDLSIPNKMFFAKEEESSKSVTPVSVVENQFKPDDVKSVDNDICHRMCEVDVKQNETSPDEKNTENVIIKSCDECAPVQDAPLVLLAPSEFNKDAIPGPSEVKVNDGGSSSDASNTTRDTSVIKSSADVSSSEDVSALNDEAGKKKTIQEKLKLKKLMTRRDRFLQNLQRPDIPDLSFKPSSKVFANSDSYMTCPESSSSTSAGKIKERKRRKKSGSERAMSVSSGGIIGYKDPPPPYANMECLVSRIVNPSEFYINHLDENIALVDTISYQLEDIYKDTKSPFKDKISAMGALGDNCVCYLENYGSWYRVTVTNWRLQAKDYQEKLVTVYLVDYGHICNSSYENLRELSEEFCSVPQCAIKCHLAWLYPLGSTKNNLLDTWPKESCDFFHNLFSKNCEQIYKIPYVEKCGNSWAVELANLPKADDGDVTFGQQMLDNNMAVEIFQDSMSVFKETFFLDQIKTAQGMAGITSAMTVEEKFEKFNENTANEEFKNIDQAMVGYRAMDEARTCKNRRPDGTCFKGKRCKLDHGRLRDDGYTTDKQCVYVTAFQQLEMPETGTKVKLRIMNVVSVNTFYACLVNSQSEHLSALIKRMNKKETIARYQPLDITPARGEVVIAKNWNNRWYRARVLDMWHYPQNAEETVQVFFVDLGDVFDAKMSEVKRITPDFLHLPFQAIQCRLYNVKPKENSDEEDAKQYIEGHYLCQIFDAEVKHASHSVLEVLLKRENSTEDIGEQIIEDGYGYLRTEHQFPIESENVLVD